MSNDGFWEFAHVFLDSILVCLWEDIELQLSLFRILRNDIYVSHNYSMVTDARYWCGVLIVDGLLVKTKSSIFMSLLGWLWTCVRPCSMDKSNSAFWTSLSASPFLVVIFSQLMSGQLKSPAKMMCFPDLHWVICLKESSSLMISLRFLCGM